MKLTAKLAFLEKYDLEIEDVQQTLFDRLLENLPIACRKNADYPASYG